MFPDGSYKTPGPKLGHVPILSQRLNAPTGHSPGGPEPLLERRVQLGPPRPRGQGEGRGGSSRKRGSYIRRGGKECCISKI